MAKFYMTISAEAELNHPDKPNAVQAKEFINYVMMKTFGVKLLSNSHQEAIDNLVPDASPSQVLVVTIEDYVEKGADNE